MNKYVFEGQIEDIDDPLKLHRVRVRVFAFHNEDRKKVPTVALPWFSSLFAMNSSQSSIPKVGEWVLVYFPDPESAQYGYVMGTIPGIVAQEEVPGIVVTARTARRPVKPPGDPAGILNFPSTSPGGREVIAGTGVDRTNQDLVHVCDITHETKRVVNAIKRQFSEVVAFLKDLLSKALKAMGFADPSGEFLKLVQLIKDVAKKIKRFADFIKDVNETIAGFLKIVRQIRAIIAYILSLPGRLLAEFQQCLSNLYKSLLAGFTSAFADFSGGSSDLTALADAVRDVGTSIKEVTTQAAILASAPQQLAAVITTPISAAESDVASKSFANFMSAPDTLSSLTPAASSLVASPEATTLVSAAILTSDNAATA